MANPKHVEILKQGVETWNQWRSENPTSHPDLSGIKLHKTNLSGGKFSHVNLKGSDLTGSRFSESELIGSDLSNTILTKVWFEAATLTYANLNHSSLFEAEFYRANLAHTKFHKSCLEKASLNGADLCQSEILNSDLHRTQFIKANLSGAKLENAYLRRTNFFGANLSDAEFGGSDFDGTYLGGTIFGNTSLIGARNLDKCDHRGPSVIDLRTIQRSGNLPVTFLRGMGLQDVFIDYLPSLLQQPIQFYSCYISHSTRDQAFAERLYADLQNKGVRCWYAPEEIKGGEKLYDQIDSAIKVHDKLLLILSEDSINSEWVQTEMRWCRKAEQREGKRKLFPIRLVDMPTLQDWECFDADYGKDLAAEVREYFISDFSNWKDHDSYKKALDRLLRDLQGSVQGQDRKL